ncbi:MAG: UDP-N-acetylmuramoyl-tripeptide--D-alanyl-D-alanine ligase [Verrucomicrobiota bacterium]|nr:UDP-N-acetylmuramoyl-tripeptide--D-alanyl-D-alanine ligase [Verrucomicrobiota bacterium]
MDPRSLKFAADACMGQLLHAHGPALFYRICTDSRQARQGDLFVALRGDRFDGHDFLSAVFSAGAVAAVVEQGSAHKVPQGVATIVVENTRIALGKIAAAYRRDFDIPMIAIAGSNGKTSTKELIASVLKQKFETTWSEGSFNNEIGVPLTLLRVEKKSEAGVFEIGTNHPGELAPLIKMVSPSIGVITSIGREHLEFFKDIAGVAQEEGWLAELLPADGLLVINGDTALVDHIIARTSARVKKVGFGLHNDWVVRQQSLDQQGAVFSLQGPDSEISGDYRIALLGQHQMLNAALSIVVGREHGLGRAEIQRGLTECRPAKMRLEAKKAGGILLLDDAYNANADSMLAALQTLRDFPCKGRRIAVLGEMSELGETALAAHCEVGRRTAELGFDHLIAIGKQATVMGHAARSAGLQNVNEISEVEMACDRVKSLVRAGDVVLVKASRSARLERVVEALQRLGSEVN